MQQRLLTILGSWAVLSMCLLTGPLAVAAPKQQLHTSTRPTLDEKTLVVYPNPSTGVVHLTINGLEGHKVDISVLNVIGSTVYRESLTELNDHYTKTLDLSRLVNGLYYVKVEAANASQLCKLVIR